MNTYLSCVNFEAKKPNQKMLLKGWAGHIPSRSEYVQAKINQSEEIKSAKVIVSAIIKNHHAPREIKIAKCGYDMYVKSQEEKYAQEYNNLVANTKYKNPIYRNVMNFLMSAKERIMRIL